MRKTLGEPLCTFGGQQFPDSRLLTPEWGALLTGWVGTTIATDEWMLCYSSFTDHSMHPAAFHSQCDAYSATVSVAHNTGEGSNAGNYTFGGFAAGSWSKETCCADPRNYCQSSFCYDQSASGDFLFGLWMPGRAGSEGPERFLPTGTGTGYQLAGPDNWPRWGGNGALSLGSNFHPPRGDRGYCNQGDTYAGSRNEICGGFQNWGATQLEIWRPACTSCGGHGVCDPITRVCACAAGYKLSNAATCVVDGS